MLPGLCRPLKTSACVQTFHPESSSKKGKKSIAEDNIGELARRTGYDRRVRRSQENLDLKENKKELWSPAGSRRGIMTVILQSISSYSPRQLGLMKVGQPLGNRKGAKQFFLLLVFD